MQSPVLLRALEAVVADVLLNPVRFWPEADLAAARAVRDIRISSRCRRCVLQPSTPFVCFQRPTPRFPRSILRLLDVQSSFPRCAFISWIFFRANGGPTRQVERAQLPRAALAADQGGAQMPVLCLPCRVL